MEVKQATQTEKKTDGAESGVRNFILVEADGTASLIAARQDPFNHLRSRIDKKVLDDMNFSSDVYFERSKGDTMYVISGIDTTPFGPPNAFFTYFISSPGRISTARLMRGEFIIEKFVSGIPVSIENADNDFRNLQSIVEENYHAQENKLRSMQRVFDVAKATALGTAIGLMTYAMLVAAMRFF